MRLITVITIIIFINFIIPVYAVDSTPSADIKTKLEELKKEIASKAAKLKAEVNRKLKDKVYAGKIKSKSATSLTISSGSGPKIISINQDTVLPKKFSEEDYIAGLGDIDETGVLTARKIVLLQPTANSLQPKTYLWGRVIAISDKLITIKIKNAKHVAASLKNPSPVKLNNFVILTGTKNKNDIFDAGFVYVFP